MATTFKDHSVTEIEKTIEKALEELMGAPVNVSIDSVDHTNPHGNAAAAALFSGPKWAATLTLRIKETGSDAEDNDLPF